MTDVTDATFNTAVVHRSKEVPVVVDLWASWCGPCKTLGPILEKVIAETEGAVELAKVDVDANPQIASAFGAQSIPAVFAVVDGKGVDGFVGALPEHQVREFVERVRGHASKPSEVDQLVAAGDESSLRKAVELEPGNQKAVLALAALLVGDGASPRRGSVSEESKQEALDLLARIPDGPETRRLAASARVGAKASTTGDVEVKLDDLLLRVKGDDEARREFLDLLEVLGPEDPRTARYRKALTAKLF